MTKQLRTALGDNCTALNGPSVLHHCRTNRCKYSKKERDGAQENPQCELIKSVFSASIVFVKCHKTFQCCSSQEEVVKEAQRQAVLARGGMDDRERIRLSRIFAVEREHAKSRILELSSAVGIGVAYA